MISTPSLSTPETQADSALRRNAEPVRIDVLASSVSLLPNGDYELLIRAEPGLVRFRVPRALASIFALTNTPGVEHPHSRTGAVTARSKTGGRTLHPDILAAFQRVLAHRASGLTWRAAAKRESVSCAAVQNWAYRQRLAALDAKTPITKPSGNLL